MANESNGLTQDLWLAELKRSISIDRMSKSIVTILVALVLSLQIPAQNPQDNREIRIRQLEAQVQTILVELEKLRRESQTPVETAKVTPAKPVESIEKRSEPDKKPIGIDIGNGIKLIPYGTIYFNAYGNSGGTNNADVPVFATQTGSGNASASVRQTRLGIKLEGARIGKARLGAVIEGDFFGGFPSVAIGENFGVFRLRLAYARLDWERTALTVGQDWMVFAPVNPVSMAAAGNPQMGGGGNLWARLPQVRVDRKLNGNVTLQAAVLQPQTGDFATNAAFFVQPTSGMASRVPFLQSRLAYSNADWFGTKKAGSIGVSGHFGRSRVFTGAANVPNDIESAGIAADWNFPVAKRVTVAGEIFWGRNLGGFQGGVLQSYNNDFANSDGSSLIPGGVRSIGTQGGWLQIGFIPPMLNNRLGIYGSFGIDDPVNSDLFSLSHRDWRTRNFVIAANAIYKFTPQLAVGAEFRRFQTDYFYSGRKNANHVNLGATYTF